MHRCSQAGTLCPSAAERICARAWLQDLRESEIRGLGVAVRHDQDVFRLQVTVNDVLAVNMRVSIADLRPVKFRLCIVKLAASVKVRKEPATSDAFNRHEPCSAIQPLNLTQTKPDTPAERPRHTPTPSRANRTNPAQHPGRHPKHNPAPRPHPSGSHTVRGHD